ncbi:hypothetical protein XH89_24190 [Bradyrhizobium sp. CCBAU 53340]|nr:hypothetical protein XH89_24190 [Bradyrhizobium sp. CCBAU 53340]
MHQLTDEKSLQSKYFIRMGGKGWMVYDRERRGPAIVGMDLAVNLTKERAEQIRHLLVTAGRRQATSGTESS